MKKRSYIWCLIELPSGEKEWYCISKVLRHALNYERFELENPYWKKALIGNYLTVARSTYIHNQARLTVGKVIKIRIYSRRPNDWHWTRNQFIAADQLGNFHAAFNYLKHDYSWYNRLAIWLALRHWQVLYYQFKIKKAKLKLRNLSYKFHLYKKS